MNLCNAAQKLELERLAGLYESDNGAMDKAYAYKLQNVRRGVNTDWIRAPLRVPFSHTHSLSLSGRAQKIDYRASLRFSDKYGVMKGDNRRNYTLNFSIGYHMRDKLTLRYTANYTLTDATDSPYGKFSAYTKLNPYESPYDEYGELVKAFYFDPEDTSTTSEGYQANPLYNATLSSFSTSRNQTLRNTVDAKWYVTKDFYVSGQFNIDVKSSQSDKYARRCTVPRRERPGQARSLRTGHGQGVQLRRQDRAQLRPQHRTGRLGIRDQRRKRHPAHQRHDLLHHGDGFPEGQPLGHQIRPGIRLLKPPERFPTARRDRRPTARRTGSPRCGRSAWDGTSTRRSSSKTSNGST